MQGWLAAGGGAAAVVAAAFVICFRWVSHLHRKVDQLVERVARLEGRAASEDDRAGGTR